MSLSALRGRRAWRQAKRSFAESCRTLTTCLAALGAAVLSAPPAAAEAVCGPRAEALAHLRANFGETPRGRGLAGPTHMVELLLGPNGSWTLIVTDTSGRACLVASGEAWQQIEAPPLDGRTRPPAAGDPLDRREPVEPRS